MYIYMCIYIYIYVYTCQMGLALNGVTADFMFF